MLRQDALHKSIDVKRLPANILKQCRVGKCTRPVVYYVAGWMLHIMSLAWIITKGM